MGNYSSSHIIFNIDDRFVTFVLSLLDSSYSQVICGIHLIKQRLIKTKYSLWCCSLFSLTYHNFTCPSLVFPVLFEIRVFAQALTD